MEIGAHVWLRSDNSRWGWVPAKITRKEDGTVGNLSVINLTLTNDLTFEDNPAPSKEPESQYEGSDSYWDDRRKRSPNHSSSSFYADQEPFEVVITLDPEQLKTADHDDIKLRNLPRSYQLNGEDGMLIQSPTASSSSLSPSEADSQIVGGVDDLIGLTHLHEPAILHALRLRYDADIIYTATGPILIAVNPFKPMSLYSQEVMEQYRQQGEQGLALSAHTSLHQTPFKRRTNDSLIRKMNMMDSSSMSAQRLPPHAYQTADDAYRAMMRGLENQALMDGTRQRDHHDDNRSAARMPTNQSILVSGESGAGKTVTTKIVLNYFAMLSNKAAEARGTSIASFGSPTNSRVATPTSPRSLSFEDDVSIEQQVLQSNPILESFGNARTIRNDNSSRFGKYIDIRFTPTGKLTGARVETYLLEKVRLIHPAEGERNYHVFYQFLSSATDTERDQFYLDDMTVDDFKLLSQTGTFDRRDGVSDASNHQEMLDAMITIGFHPETIQSLMRLIVSILFAGNMSFTTYSDDTCTLDEDHAALAVASLLGVEFEDLATAITTRTILTSHERIIKQFSVEQAGKACEALIKAIYGATFDFIVKKVNDSIDESTNYSGTPTRRTPPRSRNYQQQHTASIGVLDIFGFETFEVNNFEQLCINYTNEALQQQFNRYVFKLEQLEYEKEGILWKYIAFPDNQDVLNLIDQKHTGILAILDEQCIVPQSTDEKFTRYLYSKCDKHKRFSASSAQRVDYKFSVEHYAGPVEYTTDSWLEKNKDQLPAKSAELLKSSSFKLLGAIQKYLRTEERKGRGGGVLTNKSVGAQFSSQLMTLRNRIDTTTPHYIRCLKPNDELVADYFEPKNIVEQLRCGGVIEAVRVSRAGYPTRYPHDVFMARYYILEDYRDNAAMSTMAGNSKWRNDKEERLKALIGKIAFQVWEADHQMMINLIEAEKVQNQMMSPKRFNKTTPSGSAAPTYYSGSNIVNGPQSLAVQSSAQTPPEKRNLLNKKKNNRLSLSVSLRERTEYSQNIARPQSEEEYFNLDFVSRCAVAGLQLGRTKVFLRREAFDRIEAMRSQKFYGSAVVIQSMVRAMIYRSQFKLMRAAAIKIQTMARSKCSRTLILTMRVNSSATKIQSFWRMISTRWAVYHMIVRYRRAATIIQRTYRKVMRSRYEAIHLADSEYRAASRIQAVARGVSSRNRYYTALFGIIRLQALYRGRSVRSNVLNGVTMSNREKFLANDLAKVASEHSGEKVTPRKMEMQTAPFTTGPKVSRGINDLYRCIQDENWSEVESILDKRPELAEEVEPSSGELPLHVIARHTSAWTLLIDMVLVLYPKALIHRDNMGALPIHHAAAHDNLSALEIIYSAYKEGINDVDLKGRLPLHVASEFDAVDAVKFLLSKSSEGAFTMVYRPTDGNGGGLPLHVACRNYASIGVITALLAENFASAKRCDENGDLPLHLILRCGDVVDQVVVKTLLTCFSAAASRTDMNGDLPLSIAIKHQCKPAVVNSIMMQYPNAAGVLNSEGESALFLAFKHGADDRSILGILNHAPELVTTVDKKSGLLPIQVATEHEHSHFIVHNLLKRDLPIDLNEKVRAQLLPHHYSWNHVVSNTDDMYYQVVNKILQQCTQPQVLALAHVEGPDGKIALASATPVCKHELRVMLRLFNTLEVVNQRPAYTNPLSDTQIFYALRYEPPPTQSSAFTILHEEKKDQALGDYVEEWDDSSVSSAVSRHSLRSTLSNRSQQSIDEKLRVIRKEKGQQVIVKLTSRSDVVERELKVRKDYHLSRHYVPAIVSVHHTVQHAAYSEAMAEPGYCITMEGADTTAENLMLDMRKAGKAFPVKALKRIGISLLHMHEHGLVHCDFGTHNIGKFGSRWKLLGVGGSVSTGRPTDPNRGFYHPPESIVVESKRAPLGKKSVSACVVSIPAKATYDIWAYGVLLYEAIAGVPLSAYACRGKRAMTSAEVGKIGQWDDQSVKKALKHVDSDNEVGRDLIKKLLHHEPERRIKTMRHVLEHPFFSGSSKSGSRSASRSKARGSTNLVSSSSQVSTGNISKQSGNSSKRSSSRPRSSSRVRSSSRSKSRHSAPPQVPPRERDRQQPNQIIKQSVSESAVNDDENLVNGVSRTRASTGGNSLSRKHNSQLEHGDAQSYASGSSRKSKMFGSIRNRMKSGRSTH